MNAPENIQAEGLLPKKRINDRKYEIDSASESLRRKREELRRVQLEVKQAKIHLARLVEEDKKASLAERFEKIGIPNQLAKAIDFGVKEKHVIALHFFQSGKSIEELASELGIGIARAVQVRDAAVRTMSHRIRLDLANSLGGKIAAAAKDQNDRQTKYFNDFYAEIQKMKQPA